ncbi:MAG TPA: carbon monoxide dehydrogenase subunit G, partial [Actinomycetota bacterium]
MRIAGNATLHAPVEAVYAALQDPRVLVRTIPGCERLEQVGDDAYQMTVTAGVASVRGTYAGDVRLTDQRAPHGFTLRASGSGTPGTVAADVSVTLASDDNGTTLLTYDADATIGGMIGGVGQRLLATVAKRTAGEFFTAVDEVLHGGGVEEAGAPRSGVDEAGAPRSGVDEAGAPRSGVGDGGAPARAAGGGAGPRVYTAPG